MELDLNINYLRGTLYLCGIDLKFMGVDLRIWFYNQYYKVGEKKQVA